MSKNILDQYPELRERDVDDHYYHLVITNNPDLLRYDVVNIGLAFALSQRRSEQRRQGKKRRK